MKILLTFIFTFIIAVIVPANASAKQFADLGSDARNTLSISDEKFIGAALMQQLRAANAVCTDPSINYYLNNLGHKLLIHADIKHFNFIFFGLEDYSINAFAALGGYIGINKGLILATQNENELAAAIAHEISHVSQEHIVRSIMKNKQFLPVTLAGALASVVLGAPELGISILATHQQRMLNANRAHEKEADNIAMQLLADAGFDPQSMATLFKRMEKQAQYNTDAPEYLSTHPMLETRISEADPRAKRFSYKQSPSSFNYYLIKASIENSAHNDKAEFLAEINERLANQRYENNDATLYEQALVLAAKNELTPAHNILQGLATKYPSNLIIQLSLVEVKIAQQQLQQATTKMAELLTIFPDNLALILKYAETLIATNDIKQAKTWLLKLTKIKAPDPLVYQLLAQAESIAGNNIGAHIATAELNVLYGDLAHAITQCEMAIELLGKSDHLLKAVIEKRKLEIENMVLRRESL